MYWSLIKYSYAANILPRKSSTHKQLCQGQHNVLYNTDSGSYALTLMNDTETQV